MKRAVSRRLESGFVWGGIIEMGSKVWWFFRENCVGGGGKTTTSAPEGEFLGVGFARCKFIVKVNLMNYDKANWRVEEGKKKVTVFFASIVFSEKGDECCAVGT